MKQVATIIKTKKMVETEVEEGIALNLTFEQAEMLYGIIANSNGVNLPVLYYPLQLALGPRANSKLAKATQNNSTIDSYRAEQEAS